jgi:hypothetical protein
LSYPQASDRLLQAPDFQRLLNNRNEHPLALFCHKGCPQKIAALIPGDAKNINYGAFKFYYIQ